MKKNHRLLILITLSIVACSTLQAGGVQSLLEEYILVSESRMINQNAVQYNMIDQEYLAEVFECEEKLAAELEQIILGDNDIADEIFDFMNGKRYSCKVELFTRFYEVAGRQEEQENILAKKRNCLNGAVDYEESYKGKSVAGGALVFEKPQISAPVSAIFEEGIEMNVKGSCGTYFKVSAGGYTGWIHESQIANITDAEVPENDISKSIRGKTGVVTASFLNVRKGPSTAHKIVCTVKNGDKLKISDTASNGWHKVRTPKGNSGWASGKYIKITGNDNNDDTEDTSDTVDDNDDNNVPDTNIPSNTSNYTKISNKKPTYYYTARQSDFPAGSNKTIKSTSGKTIAKCGTKFYKAICMQGSGILNDGRCVTWVGNYRFKVAPSGCKGITATGYWVVPFHTLAVNRKQMPYKNVYYIPKSKSLNLPNGQKHDGFWFSHDTGGAFIGSNNRIDCYVDKKGWWKWMEHNMVGSHTPIKVYKVDSKTRSHVYSKYKSVLGK